MGNVFFLRKSLDGFYYLHNMDGGTTYDLNRLAKNYPQNNFIVVNSDEQYPYPNVRSRWQVLKTLKIDDDLELTCHHCQHSNRYTKSECDECGTELPEHGLMKTMLGEDYTKAFHEIGLERFMREGTQAYRSGFRSFVAKPADPKQPKADPFHDAIEKGKTFR